MEGTHSPIEPRKADALAEPGGPPGDASRHLPLAEIERLFLALPPPPADSGRLAQIVRRRADGAHETLDVVCVTPESGVPGDRWERRLPHNPDTQLTVMRRDVAELVANGQPIEIAGDNFFVDLDIAAASLPAGSRLRIGAAIFEVTPKAHNGCLKFKGRFGADALQFVNAGKTRHLNLRGVCWKVIEAGQISVGASIEVLSRP